jgi:hypothetical protein
MSRPLYPPGKEPGYLLNRRMGGHLNPCGRFGEVKNDLSLSVYIYIYICVCVCVCIIHIYTLEPRFTNNFSEQKTYRMTTVSRITNTQAGNSNKLRVSAVKFN